MPPNKSKRSLCREDSPDREEKRSKRKRLSDVDDEEDPKEGTSAGCSSSKLKTPSGGQSSHNKPAELFRKDLISAMKLADSEPLNQEDYLLIADPWRQEWERGVQVPVNEENIPAGSLNELRDKSKLTGDFKIPKKYLHAFKDDTYRQGMHELTGMQQMSEQVVRYDLDDLDTCWLQRVNEEREEMGEILIHEWIMERVIEALETQCYEQMENKKKTEEGLGIEYDEDIVCEVCHSPDSEDNNEMVFCDGCDICVHQACYGIQTVPDGSWLCRACALGVKPTCILCPKSGGAMKSTRSGTKWAHVSCAIWIPEVTIACVEKMEPITKISQVPASRWSLICCLCKERTGACIQCSVKTCKTAFHVSCAFSNNLEMKTILLENEKAPDDEAVKLKAFCPKHSKHRERNASESETDSPRKSNCGTPRKLDELTEEERDSLRQDRLKRLEEEFYSVINIGEIARHLDLDEKVISLIYVFWKLKRKISFDKPLLTPKTEEAEFLEKQQEDSLVARMKMFVHLRQDLERVRNLCYMVSRREKMKRQFDRLKESTFYGALDVLTDNRLNLPTREVDKIMTKYRTLIPEERSPLFPAKLPSLLFTPVDSDQESVYSVSKASVSSEVSSNFGKRNRYVKRTRRATGDSLIDTPHLPGVKTKDTDNFQSDGGGDGSNLLSVDTYDGTSVKSETVSPSMTGRRKRHSPNRFVKKERKGVTETPHLPRLTTDVSDFPREKDVNITNNALDSVTESANTDSSSVDLQTKKPEKASPKSPRKSHKYRRRHKNPYWDRRKNRIKKSKPKLLQLSSKLVGNSSQGDSNKETPVGVSPQSAEAASQVTKVESHHRRSEEMEIDVVNPILETISTELSECGKIEEDVLSREQRYSKLIDTASSVNESKDKSRTPKSSKECKLQASLEKESPDENLDSSNVIETRRSHRRHSTKVEPIEYNNKVKGIDINSFPSAKMVSEHVKSEICHYLRTNQFVVSDKIRTKVQNRLLKRRKNHVMNGINGQKKLDSFFTPIKREDDSVLVDDTRNTRVTRNSSPLTNGDSRVLNELSPSKDRVSLEQNHLYGTHASPKGSLSGYRIPKKSGTTPDPHQQSPLQKSHQSSVEKDQDVRTIRRNIGDSFESTFKERILQSVEKKHRTRSSRETTPEPDNLGRGEGGVGKVGSEKVGTRSSSPMSSCQDLEGCEVIDVENLYDDVPKRKTRSSVMDREGSQSPRSFLRSQVKATAS